MGLSTASSGRGPCGSEAFGACGGAMIGMSGVCEPTREAVYRQARDAIVAGKAVASWIAGSLT